MPRSADSDISSKKGFAVVLPEFLPKRHLFSQKSPFSQAAAGCSHDFCAVVEAEKIPKSPDLKFPIPPIYSSASIANEAHLQTHPQ